MTERYLEDFAIGQAFGSGKIRINKERAKAFAAEFDRSLSTSMRRRRAARSSMGWLRAAGTPPR